uniref:Uncharacterized protein n=1 Tax=Chelydra serpentina TaxID=8475 RepID=A0A8C3XJF1_CHESE
CLAQRVTGSEPGRAGTGCPACHVPFRSTRVTPALSSPRASQLDNSPDFFLFLCGLLGPLLKTFERAAAFLVESGYQRHGARPPWNSPTPKGGAGRVPAVSGPAEGGAYRPALGLPAGHTERGALPLNSCTS